MRLILPLGWVSLLLLIVASGVGFLGSTGTRPQAHIYSGIIAVLGVLLAQSLSTVYFLGILNGLKEVARRRSPARRILEARSLPPSTVPMSAAVLGATMAGFILGGGAHTGAVPSWLHGGLALLAVTLHAVSLRRQQGAFAELRTIVQAVEEQVGPLD